MIRTRFAPSPTGSLHIGNARIAVLNWLLARGGGGRFVLRIEDTDVGRNVAGAEEAIFRDLRWLGLDWDEGPAFEGAPPPGPHEPYRQSERGALYTRAALELRRQGATFDCFCVDEEPASPAGPAHARITCRCDGLGDRERAALIGAGRTPAHRFRVGAGEDIVVTDAIRGEVPFARDEVGDFVILRADGRPTYNFAVVVDDIGMEITHVVRGVGHLSNTPRQVLLYRAFGREQPVFAHVPTVLGPDRQKLSKRHGAPALADYRRQGYHPDGLINYLSLLSWSSPSGDELLDRDRLVQEISLDRIGASDVVYDPDKLRWLSAKHIDRMPLEDLVAAVRPFLGGGDADLPAEALPVAVEAVRTHLAAFAEIDDELARLMPGPDGDEAAWLDGRAVEVLGTAAEVLAGLQGWDRPSLEEAIRTTGRRTGAKGPALYGPLRLALTGREHGPPFWAVLAVQGRARVLARLAEVSRQRAPKPVEGP